MLIIDFILQENIYFFLIALCVLACFLSISLFIYLKSTPENLGKRLTISYNILIFIVILVVCFIVSLHSYSISKDPVYGAWWELIACVNCLILSSIILIIGALFRNTIIFRVR